MEIIFMNTENSKANEPHRFFLKLSQRLGLRSSNKYVALQNLFIYYAWKNVKKNSKKQSTKNNGSNLEL